MQNRVLIAPNLNVVEAVLSFLGAGIAGMLWWAHRSSIELPCTGDGHGCDTVADSRWASLTLGPWHDIPVALLGLLTYIALLTLCMMKMGAESPVTARRLHGLVWAISAAGFGYSWYLQYTAHFFVHAFCPWCFSSACVMTLLFAAATWERLASRRASVPDNAQQARQTTHA